MSCSKYLRAWAAQNLQLPTDPAPPAEAVANEQVAEGDGEGVDALEEVAEGLEEVAGEDAGAQGLSED